MKKLTISKHYKWELKKNKLRDSKNSSNRVRNIIIDLYKFIFLHTIQYIQYLEQMKLNCKEKYERIKKFIT